MATSMRVKADRAERLVARGLIAKAEEIVRALDTHRMRTNSATAHREWERAYRAVNNG